MNDVSTRSTVPNDLLLDTTWEPFYSPKKRKKKKKSMQDIWVSYVEVKIPALTEESRLLEEYDTSWYG